MQENRWQHISFREASAEWLESRKRYISPRTLHDYGQYVKTLNVTFGELRVDAIHIGHVRHFQAERTKAAGNTRTNHELSALVQILKRAGVWPALEPYYEPLPLPKPKTGKAISQEDEDRLFLLASKKPRWKVAYWASSLTANTTAGPGEIRHLRIGDIDIPRKMIYIREGTKNDFRVRKIPLNATAFKQALRLVERAEMLAEKQQHTLLAEDCLLPHRASKIGAGWDFTRPMYSWNTAWTSLRKAAGMPDLRMYDLRHLAITKLLENPNVSDETVQSIAGHVSKRMFETYSHIRIKAREDAVAALEPKKPERVELALVQKTGK